MFFLRDFWYSLEGDPKETDFGAEERQPLTWRELYELIAFRLIEQTETGTTPFCVGHIVKRSSYIDIIYHIYLQLSLYRQYSVDVR